MSARLTWFYGGDPWQWIGVLPMGLVRAFARMVPRLQAEESCLAAERVAMGTGSFKEESAMRAVASRWREALGSVVAPARARATPQQLAAIGIGVRRVKPAPREADGR